MQSRLTNAQGDANIAVHQAQTVIVAGHQHRAPLVPEFVCAQQAAAGQQIGDALVDTLDAPLASAYRTKQLKAIKSAQHGGSPSLPARIISNYLCPRAQTLECAQIGAVARQRTLTTQHQRAERRVVAATQAATLDVIKFAALQQIARGSGVAAIDRTGQFTDTAGGAKAVGVAQHGGLLLQ